MGIQFKAVRKFMFILLAGSLLCQSGAQATPCFELLQKEVAVRAQAKAEFVQGMKFSAYVMVPLTLIFPYWGGAFDLIEGVSTGVSAIRLRNAEKALQVYAEAYGSGGKLSERLYRKFKRHYPESRASYTDFLAAIHEADLKGEGCEEGKIPTELLSFDFFWMIEGDFAVPPAPTVAIFTKYPFIFASLTPKTQAVPPGVGSHLVEFDPK